MARTIDVILKQQLGNLLAEIAVLTSVNETLTEENTELKKELATLKGEPKE